MIGRQKLSDALFEVKNITEMLGSRRSRINERPKHVSFSIVRSLGATPTDNALP
jgi:hypothetical protein